MLLLFLSILLLSSTHFQNGVQSATAQSTTPQNNVRMIGLQLQLMQNGTNYFTAVNNSRNAKIMNAENNTIARFIASFVNDDPTQSYMIHSFNVYMFNSTVTTVAAQTLTFPFDTTAPGYVVIPANGSYTGIFQKGLPFTLIDNELFTLQYQFEYGIAGNVSDVNNLNAPFNFTVNASLPPYAPPNFIIWAWWGINGAIVIQFLFGWYGNRKMRNRTKDKR